METNNAGSRQAGLPESPPATEASSKPHAQEAEQPHEPSQGSGPGQKPKTSPPRPGARRRWTDERTRAALNTQTVRKAHALQRIGEVCLRLERLDRRLREQDYGNIIRRHNDLVVQLNDLRRQIVKLNKKDTHTRRTITRTVG